METRHKTDNPRQEDTNTDYNPTARNFDHTDVSGAPDTIGRNIRRGDKDDSDLPLTEQDLQETGLTDEAADKIGWDEPDTSGRESGGMAREQDGPVK